MKWWTRWQDWTNLVVGLYLMCAPLLSSDSPNGASAWTALIFGATISAVALWALAQPNLRAPEGTNAVTSTVLVLAPWLFGYTEYSAATINAVFVGVVVLCLCLGVFPVMTGRTNLD